MRAIALMVFFTISLSGPACYPATLFQDDTSGAQLSPDQQKRIAEAKAKEEEANALKAQADAQKAAADAAKDAADADAAAEKAKHPSIQAPDLSNAASSVAVGDEKDFFETEVLSAQATRRLGATIAGQVADAIGAPKTVVIFGTSELDDLFKLKVVKSQIAVLESSLGKSIQAADTLTGTPVNSDRFRILVVGPGATEAVNGALQSAVSLLSFLKTDTTIGVSKATSDVDLLQARTAGLLAADHMNVFIPHTVAPGILNVDKKSALLDQLEELIASRISASAALTQLDDYIADMQRKLDKKQIDQAAFDDAEAKKKIVETDLTASATSADKEIGSLTEGADAQASFAALYKSELLYSNVCQYGNQSDGCPDTYLLLIDVRRAGGSYKTKKSIVTLFTGPALYLLPFRRDRTRVHPLPRSSPELSIPTRIPSSPQPRRTARLISPANPPARSRITLSVPRSRTTPPISPRPPSALHQVLRCPAAQMLDKASIATCFRSPRQPAQTTAMTASGTSFPWCNTATQPTAPGAPAHLPMTASRECSPPTIPRAARSATPTRFLGLSVRAASQRLAVRLTPAALRSLIATPIR